MARGRFAIALAALVAVVLAWPASPLLPPVALGAPEPLAYALPVRVAAAPPRSDLEAAVLNLLNDARVAAGLVPLMPNAALRRVARRHAREMFAWGYLSHISRDGRTPLERVLAAGLHVRIVGENVAYAANVRAAHDALMASPPHRENILYPAYRMIGIGVVNGGPKGVIVVEDFTGNSTTSPLSR